MSEPGPNCRSDHSPLTGTVAHRRRHHQDCENRVHVQNQARSSPENDFPVASANIADCPSPKATHVTSPVGSAISFGNTVRTICHDNSYLSLSPSRNTSHSSMGRSDCARTGRRRTGNAAALPSRHVTNPARTRSASPPGRRWPNVGVTQQAKPSCYTKITAVDLIHSPGGADPSNACPSSLVSCRDS